MVVVVVSRVLVQSSDIQKIHVACAFPPRWISAWIECVWSRIARLPMRQGSDPGHTHTGTLLAHRWV